MRKSVRFLLVATAVGLAGLAAIACSSGVSQQDYDAAVAEAAAAKASATTLEQEIKSLQDQLKGTAPTIIVQADISGDAGSVVTPEGWETAESIKANAKLIGSYDSSGPDAWDASAHPTVFVTSEGNGYAGFYSETYKVAGLQIIDAATHEAVAAAGFDLGTETMGTPHGLGVSPDGQWIYVPTSTGTQPWQHGPDGGRLMVVNARTLKLDTVIGTTYGPHHVKGFIDSDGNQRVIVETQGGSTLLLDPDDNHRVVFQIGANELKASAYQAAADPSGKYLYIGTHLGPRGIAQDLIAAVAKVEIATGRITWITGVGMYPNGFAFTSDGRFTYVADSSGDRVYKIDNSTSKVVAHTQAAVPGPYNLALNQDETELWVVGKGEMTYNLGGSLALIDTRTFRAVRDYNIQGQTIDHIIMNPADPTEMWVTSSGTAETIVFDLTTRTVKNRIPTVNGGDTHSGAFVKYGPGFAGELVADVTGPHGSWAEEVKQTVAASAR